MALVRLTDAEIIRLLEERKPLPPGWRTRLLRLNQPQGFGHERSSLSVYGDDGGHFTVNVRVNMAHPNDFSVILAYALPQGGVPFHLRRYNGLHPPGWHPNKIERTIATGFHVHEATERYQQRGFREDGFARESTRYSNAEQAVDLLVEECAFVVPAEPTSPQLLLFRMGLPPRTFGR